MFSTRTMRRFDRSGLLKAATGLLLAASAVAIPQIATAQDVVVTPLAKESAQNVTVNDSPEARKDLETARSMEQQKEWLKAAGWYQQVLEKYRTRVVPWKADSDNVIDRYRGIVYQVQQSLAKWPAEGIEAYRRQYESTADAMLAKAGPQDADALGTILATYFITDAAKTAGIRLIDLDLEAGDFDAAAQVGQLLLDSYPRQQLIADRPAILFRTALAHHLCRENDAATKLAKELHDSFPQATGRVFGKDVLLNTELAQLLQAAPPWAQTGAPDSWMMFGGSPDRAHVSSALGHIGARIFSIDLQNQAQHVTPLQAQINGESPAAAMEAMQSEEERGMFLGIMPVVDAGELFFQDGHRIWARQVDSGVPLPGWAETYGGDEDLKGVYQLPNTSPTHGGQYTLTLTENCVLAVMGQPNRFAVMFQDRAQITGGSGTRLVCLDRKSGQQRWVASLGNLEGPSLKDEEKERLRALEFSGSPLVVGNNVFVIARGGKDPQFENCYVLCLDLTNGHYRWSCLVASAGAPLNVYAANNGESEGAMGTLSHLAYSGGRLYVMTNLSAVAAIDAYDGSVVWLSLYSRDGIDPTDGNGFRWVRGGRPWGLNLTTQKPWEYNPIIEHDGKLFVLPVDSKYLMVYDAATGEQLKAIDVSQFQDIVQAKPTGFDRPRTLVGLIGNQLIMTGNQEVYALKWDTYDPQRQMSDNAPQNIVYTRLRMDDPQQVIRGRAILAAGSLVVTTSRKLYRLDVTHDLRITEVYPTGGQQEWDESEGPGNVIATADHVIIAGSRSVNVYTDMSLARSKLDKEVAAAPQEPAPRLHYGEVMFAAGQAQLALDKLNEAVTLLGGHGQMRSGPERQRIFNDALNFSKRLANDKRGESNEEALKFFDLAADAADSPIEQVSYRLRRARFARDNIDPTSYQTAVRLYQDILDHPDWRRQGVHRDDENSPQPVSPTALDIQAGDLAEHEIHEILTRHPEAYAAEEKLAVPALEKAQQSGNPQQLLAVADQYPNAAVASKAMLLAAASSENAGQPRQAAHLLRQIYRKYGDTADKSAILEAMVRNYLNLPGGLELAKARLRRAKNFADTRLAGSLKLPDGTELQNVTFKEALAAMDKVHMPPAALAEIDLHVPPMVQNPDGSWPHAFSPKDAKAISISGITSLISAPETVDNAWMRPDRVVAVQNFEHLAIFAAGDSKPLGTTDALATIPRFALWLPTQPASTQPTTAASTTSANRSKLLVWSGTEVALLDGSTAQPLWKSPVNALPACELINAAGLSGVQVSTDTLPGGAVRQNAVIIDARGGRRIFIRNGPMVQQLVVETPRQAGPEQICQLQPIGDHLIAGTNTGRIVCLAISDGKLIWQMRVSARPIERLVANEDFTALTVNDDGNTVRLMVLDNFNGQVQLIRNFAADQGLIPQNLALSPDGMLVWTLPDRLCGQDLYEPGNQPGFEYPSIGGAASGGQPNLNIRGPVQIGGGTLPMSQSIYAGCTRPGQLIIDNGRILALEQSGRFVVAHSLEDGSILTHHDEHGASIPTQLSTNCPANANPQQNAAEANVTLRTAGHYLYVLSPKSLIAYNIDDPALDQWRADPTILNANPNYKTAWPVHDKLVIEGEPPGDQAQNNDIGAAVCELRIFDRRQIPEPDGSKRQGGKLEYIEPIHDASGIVQLQPVTGGFYWLSGDHTLHFWPGSAK